MTPEQEATEVQALTPTEQAKYRVNQTSPTSSGNRRKDDWNVKGD